MGGFGFVGTQGLSRYRQLLNMSRQSHCEVMDVRDDRTQHLIAVYAQNTMEQRKYLWDFVTRRCSTDRYQGNAVTPMDIQDFNDCLTRNNHLEIRAVGYEFTWSNSQEGSRRICSNIDRCLANTQWFNEYSHVIVERLRKGVSVQQHKTK